MGSLIRSLYFIFLVFSLQDLSAETTYKSIRWQAYDFHMLLTQPFIHHFLVMIPQILDFERGLLA